MTNRIAQWLADYFDSSNASDSQDTVINWGSNWGLAPWMTVLLVFALAALVVGLYSTEKSNRGKFWRGFLSGLRISAYAIILLMIAQWILVRYRTGLPALVIMVDDSASMGIVDKQLSPETLERTKAQKLAEPTRLALAKTLLSEKPEHWKTLNEKYRIQLYKISDQASLIDARVPETKSPKESGAQNQNPTSLRDEATYLNLTSLGPNGKQSRLGQGVLQLLNERRGQPPSAIVLFTDGATTDGPQLHEAAEVAYRMGVPLYLIGLGSEIPQRDIDLSEIVADEYAFVEDMVNFDFQITGTGYTAQSVEVTLEQKTDPNVSPSPTNAPQQPTAPSTESLAKQTLKLDGTGKPQRVRLTWRPPRVGDYTLVVKTPKLADETRTDNNERSHTIHVRDEKIRVLLAAAEPSYDYRNLKEYLAREKSIDLRIVLQDADPDFVEVSKKGEKLTLPTIPAQADELNKFDAVILCDVNPTLISTATQRNLGEYVKSHGGALVVLAGPRNIPTALRGAPWDELLPIEISDAKWSEPATDQKLAARVRPTDLGYGKPFFQLGNSISENEEIWSRRLDTLYTWLEISRLKPASQVLAEHPTRTSLDGQPLPLVVLRFTGSGKVLFHATDETWRWRARYGDQYYGRYWLQAIRYLCRAKFLSQDSPARIAVDRKSYSQGENVRLEVRLLDEAKIPLDKKVIVKLDQPDGTSKRIELTQQGNDPALFQTTLARLATGEFRATILAPTFPTPVATQWLMQPPPGELQKTELDVAELTRAATESKGKFYRFDTADQVWNDLPKGRRIPLDAMPPLPLWNRWPVLAVVLGLFVTEWLLRKKCGMI